MADLSKIKLNNTNYNIKDAESRTQIGTLSNLSTTAKSNLVSAINEIAANSGSNNSSSTYDTEWEEVYGEWQGGYYYDPDNNLAYTQIPSTETAWSETELYTSVSCTPYNNLIPVIAGEKYRYRNMPIHFDSKNAEVPSIIIFDSTKTPVISYTRTYQDEFTYFTIPADGVWMAVLYANSQTYILQKQAIKHTDQKIILDTIKADYRAYVLTVPPVQNTLTKGYICMGTDDLRPWETKNLHTLYTSNNIPYYMAVVPENIKACVTNDPYKTNLDYMRLCVANGGEIICHGGDDVVITETNKNDFDTMYKCFCKGKREMEYYGFKVRGIFKAGGQNAIYDAADPTIDSWAIHYFDFGDYYTTRFPYHFDRVLLDDQETYTGFVERIQNICTNHTYGIFTFHAYDSNTELTIQTMLDTLENYTEGVDYEFVTPSQLYDILMPTLPPSGSGGSIVDTNTTYSLSMINNRIILTPSSGTATYIDLPVYSGGVSS